jgi:para-aminobenzoate synthetase component 1
LKGKTELHQTNVPMPISAEKVFELMDIYGGRADPFLFGIDFDVKYGFFIEPDKAFESGVYFNINGVGSNPSFSTKNTIVSLIKSPCRFIEYEKSFNLVHQNLVAGNSYLTNLTFATPIQINIGLPEIFERSKARYRLLFGDKFVVFSPEIFVRISKGKIRSFPMKGTIDASLPNAEELILSNTKETAEHNTIVDLIRNDLSMVASGVKIDRFRYIEKIVTHEKSLLQVSSEISGDLPPNYASNLGNIFKKLLPAGSISGAPKKKTIEIIHEAETHDRGFYTGVFGYFDGSKLDSGVMIRFIKNENGKLSFCSGGGITAKSILLDEYNELIDKVYVPFV